MMRQWLIELLALQEIDLRIRENRKKLETIPSEKERIDSEIAEEERKRDKILAEARSDEQKLKAASAQEEAVREEIQKLLIQSTQVKKAVEYNTMLKQIEEKKAAVSDLETEELLLMDKIEADKKAVEEAEKLFTINTRDLRRGKKELDELAGMLQEKCAGDLQLRKLHEEKMDPSMLAAYSRLLAGKKGPPAAPVVNGSVCGWCSLKLTPQTLNDAKRGVLTFCDNCSHIVYQPDNPAQ